MNVAVFTPTYRPGGLDVTVASLMRQNFNNFVWLVDDQIYDQRKEVWKMIEETVEFPVSVVSSQVAKGNKRSLCAAYNLAADYVSDSDSDFDLFISLQDYIWLPEDGIQRFVDDYTSIPTALLTGVTHISRDPYPNKVVSKNSGFTIFEVPYHDKPKRLSWEDVRVKEMYTTANPDSLFPVELGHWEANWAAVPVDIFKEGIRWDENYDKGIAYENMDFARECNRKLGTQVWLDNGNIAISLPHKDYFDGEREEIEEFSNRDYYEEKWKIL